MLLFRAVSRSGSTAIVCTELARDRFINEPMKEMERGRFSGWLLSDCDTKVSRKKWSRFNVHKSFQLDPRSSYIVQYVGLDKVDLSPSNLIVRLLSS